MILIADSGATKTDWWIGCGAKDGRLLHTQGLNPFHLSHEQIYRVIADELMPQIEKEAKAISHVYFYGAGCLPQKTEGISEALSHHLCNAEVSIGTDLLGAARALCGNDSGVACILGTGANSCLYDGSAMVANTPPLGYILGDEGSGAYLGKRFVGDCLKGLMPQELTQGLLDELHLTVAELLDRVYRQPQAARFLASVAPYIYKHKDHPQVKLLLEDCFTQFFVRNVLRYVGHPSLGGGELPPVSFVGSVAWHFQGEIKAAAQRLNLHIGRFLKGPIYKLVEFYSVV